MKIVIKTENQRVGFVLDVANILNRKMKDTTKQMTKFANEGNEEAFAKYRKLYVLLAETIEGIRNKKVKVSII